MAGPAVKKFQLTGWYLLVILVITWGQLAKGVGANPMGQASKSSYQSYHKLPTSELVILIITRRRLAQGVGANHLAQASPSNYQNFHK